MNKIYKISNQYLYLSILSASYLRNTIIFILIIYTYYYNYYTYKVKFSLSYLLCAYRSMPSYDIMLCEEVK